jgi:hypothetical protein
MVKMADFITTDLGRVKAYLMNEHVLQLQRERGA